MHEHQTSIVRRQLVVNDHLFPFSECPEVETECAAVAFGSGETLVLWNDLLQQVWILAEARRGSQQPTVTYE